MAMKREQILELMFGAKERYHTARATIREWRDEKTAAEVRERFAASEAYRRTFGHGPGDSSPSRYETEEFERTWRVWHERPDRWRQEAELPDGSGTEYRVIDGRSFWYYSPQDGVHAATTASGSFGPEFEIAYVFDPESGAPDLCYLEMRIVDRVRHAGREALRVEAKMPGEWEYPPEPLWWGADDYDLVVDAERGVILHLASRLEGRAFDITEVLDVDFDETFPEGTFTLDLPGVRFDRVERLT
jgi:hypothetical protein